MWMLHKYNSISKNKCEKSWVRWMFTWLLHMTIVLLEVNIENLEWGKCLCKCYVYDCSSQSKYEKN
jgi:hypothetical protein